jgi:DNA mismatch repair protein MutS2
MMKCFPESAFLQLELGKVKELLLLKCKTAIAKEQVENLRIHTVKDYIEIALQQTAEYKTILQTGQYFPNDFVANMRKELQLLGIPGAMLSGDQFLEIKKLCANTENIFRWFDNDRRDAWPGLTQIINDTYYEKEIKNSIEEVLDEYGTVKDNATPELQKIRQNLYKKRSELRKLFDRIIQKLQKSGSLADIEESFMNGRKVVAVFAEQKRMVKGIFHGESDTRKTTFIEPEETITYNNEIFSLENEERNEVYRILKKLTTLLSHYAPLLKVYYQLAGNYDFVKAKALLAIDMHGHYPILENKSHIHLIKAYHPLLYLYNLQTKKPTIPVDIHLSEKEHILVISGPNAGGKTVTLKTVGLLQIMLQSGLLVPVDPSSTFGIFKQLLIHIGDTQSIEFELSTYSSHLKNMKAFMENANGRTLFFIDELGSGSDPNLGGAFAEVIMEELAFKRAFGIVTTHYLNLKVMAGKVKGIVNGAMAFDEKKLEPLYKLIIGKPGSSYTFSIAERIGLSPHLIAKAKKLANDDQFLLDKLLNRTEQDLRKVENKDVALQKLIKQNEALKKEMEQVLNKEKHRQQVEILQQQNKVKETQIAYLKDMERKLKQVVQEWKKTENKNEVMKQLQYLLFNQQKKEQVEKINKKLEAKFIVTDAPVVVGSKAKIIKNHQIGLVETIKGKNVVVRVGLMPITVKLTDIETIIEKQEQNLPNTQ